VVAALGVVQPRPAALGVVRPPPAAVGAVRRRAGAVRRRAAAVGTAALLSPPRRQQDWTSRAGQERIPKLQLLE